MHQPMQGAHAQRERKDTDTPVPWPADLSDGEAAILRRLHKAPIELRWGKSGWVAERLPRPAKRADFDRLLRRFPALVEVVLARLVLVSDPTLASLQPTL